MMNIINSPLAASQSNSGIFSSWNTNTPHRPSFSSHLSAPFDTSTVNNVSLSHHVHKDSLPIFSFPISPPPIEGKLLRGRLSCIGLLDLLQFDSTSLMSIFTGLDSQ